MVYFSFVKCFILASRQMSYLNFYRAAQEFKACQIIIGFLEQTRLYSVSITSANLPTNNYTTPYEILFLKLDLGLMSYSVSEQIKNKFLVFSFLLYLRKSEIKEDKKQKRKLKDEVKREIIRSLQKMDISEKTKS